jgi:hypothetical protein
LLGRWDWLQVTKPDYGHAELQGLLRENARLRIELGLIQQLLDDPEQEFTAMDMEHWGSLHDRLQAALRTASRRPA